jgi:hypothetical protein
MHDDGAVQADHIKSARGICGLGKFIMALVHVLPPSLFDVSLKLDTQRPVVPKAIESTVNFAGLEHEAIGFAVGDEFVHQVFNSHKPLPDLNLLDRLVEARV